MAHFSHFAHSLIAYSLITICGSSDNKQNSSSSNYSNNYYNNNDDDEDNKDDENNISNKPKPNNANRIII